MMVAEVPRFIVGCWVKNVVAWVMIERYFGADTTNVGSTPVDDGGVCGLCVRFVCVCV